MIKMRLLMAVIAIAAVSTTGCSPKVVGDSNTTSEKTMGLRAAPADDNTQKDNNSMQNNATYKEAGLKAAE